MKKVLISVLCLICVLCTTSFAACGNNAEFTLNVDEQSYTFTRYNGSDNKFEIPKEYNGLPVNSIGNGAFAGCSSLESITIPNSITYIGISAFISCSNLLNITIPDSVLRINDAFINCSSLSEIYIGSKLTDIGIILNCKNLTNINVSNDNAKYKTIDGNLYSKDGTKLVRYAMGKKQSTFIVPNEVTEIEQYALDDCDFLTSITISDAVKIIGTSMSRCKNLTSINVSENNQNFKSINGNLFNKSGKTILRYAAGKSESAFIFPENIVSIGYMAFESCKNLTNITIPNSVTAIGESAFSGCSGLTSITIPSSVTSIGSMAFESCSNLTIITVIGNTKYHSSGNCLIKTASKTLIAGCKNSIIPTDGSVTSIGGFAFESCSGLTSVTIPDSVTSIGNYAFYNCNSLTSVTIGNGVTSIGRGTFALCSSLASITFNGTKEQWNNITKDHDWEYDTSITQVVCSDGTIEL